MSKTYNWTDFCNMLCDLGPDLLLGIDEEMRDVIRIASSSTDMFWSEELQVLLEQGLASGSIRDGVLLAIGRWRENVLSTLDANFGIELDWQGVNLDLASPLLDELVAAASAK